MATVSEKNIIRVPKLSALPAFREPDARVAGIDLSQSLDDSVEGEALVCEVPEKFVVEIGVPEDLQIESERVVKKGTGTFIDVVVSFEPAAGADYYQFRVAKITEDEEGGD